MNAIRENQFIASPVQEESKKVDDRPKVDIHMSRADELIKNDRIEFSPKLGTFTTKGTDDQPKVVTLFPEKCSCSLKSYYHILAVKKSLGMVYQNNSDDCGLYVIANAVAEAFGIDPTTQEYDTELMRNHLIHCFEQNEMQLFPARSRKTSNIDGVRYSAYLKIFCTCQMPDDGQYVICVKCSIWYHPVCEGLEINQIP